MKFQGGGKGEVAHLVVRSALMRKGSHESKGAGACGVIPVFRKVEKYLAYLVPGRAQAVQPFGGGNASGADFLCYCLPQIFKPSGNDVRSGIFCARYGGELLRQKGFFRSGGQQVVQNGIHLVRPFCGSVRHAGKRLARHVLDKEGARIRNGFPVGYRQGIQPVSGSFFKQTVERRRVRHQSTGGEDAETIDIPFLFRYCMIGVRLHGGQECSVCLRP